MNKMPRIRRRKWKLQPDPSQVICRPHVPGGDPCRIHNIIERVLSLSEAQAEELLDQVRLDFSDRHRQLGRIFRDNFALVAGYLPPAQQPDETRRTLIGAYFTMEYALASAALFNPSIVPHPDQSGVAAGSLRFVMSLRAVGEGHISSIVFRSGIIDDAGRILFDPLSDYIETPLRKLDPSYDKHLFELKLIEMKVANEVTENLLGRLPGQFSFRELQHQMEQLVNNTGFDPDLLQETLRTIDWLANSNYELDFHAEYPIGDRVIFPTSANERSGLEDARFVRFHDENGETTYYATYTAYDGVHILPQLIETPDFQHFKVITLNGRAVQNKGMALFPRKIKGKYAMLSRQDGENNYIMYSHHLHFWQTPCLIQQPREPWEFVQLGNCGSPLETSEGWLVLTHGVGPMREYSIGAILLDLEDPSRVIARLKEPLLSPHAEEREGYVPNVVYSCGGLIHNNELIIPYAMSDISSGMVSVNVRELIACMKGDGP